MRKWLCKKVFIFLMGLLCYALTNAQVDTTIKKAHNKIDELTTSTQVGDFLKSLNAEFSTFHVNDSLRFSDTNCKHLSDSLHCTSWFKADFDNNGNNDLVVVGGWDNHAIFCILDSGNNRYAVNRLTKKIFQNCTFPLLQRIGNNNVLLYYSLSESKPVAIKEDTLIYKFGNFINYHSSSANHHIQKIELTTHECFGQCPQFEMIIDSSRKAIYNAIKFNKTSGDFEGVIDNDNFEQLNQLLNYIHFPNLKDDYVVNWSDAQNCTLKITYDNGRIKTINDNGMQGTFGLEQVYQILFGWRDNQQWKQILPGEKRTERTSE